MKKVKRKNKERIMEMIRKAGDPDNYKISWDVKGIPYKIQEKANIKKGGKSRAAGTGFELKVRKDLEKKGRIVDKWTNNIEFEKDADEQIIPSTGKIIISRKYNPFKKMLVIGTGFPDFISIKHIHEGMYSVIGVEVKMNGILSKIEKEKCAWYLKNKVFSQIWIAKKGKKRGQIEYDDFLEKYGKKYNKI
jgi:hypothetical protein